MSQDSSRCYRGRTGCVKNVASVKHTRGYSKCSSSGRNTSGCRRSSDRNEEGKIKKKKHSLSPLNMQDELTKRLIVHHKRGITSKPLTLAEIPYVKRKKIKVEPMLALGGFKESRSNRPVKRLTVSSLPAIMKDRDSRSTITSNREFSIMSLMGRKRLSSAPVIPPIRKRASDVESIDKTSMTEECDHMELIQRFKDMKEYTFVYLQYAVPRHHALFTPYNFVIFTPIFPTKLDDASASLNHTELLNREVTFDQTDGMDYTTISPEGVTQYSIGEAVFTSLHKWEANYNRYKKIAKMTMFRNYRMWKGFKVWQKGVSWMKYQYAQEYIFRTLFIADIQLGAALIHVMKKRYDLSLFSFYNKKAVNNLPFFYYIEDQMVKYETTRDTIMDFRDDTCEYLYSGMEASLWIRGFTTDDRNFARMDDDTGEVRIHQDCMTFTQQANKRKYCERLSRFLTICDYHMISMLREILERTYNDSTDKWTSHYVLRPTDEQLEDENVRIVLEAKRGSKCPQLPMFAIDLVMTTDGVQPDPSEEIFMSITNQLIELWESYSYGFMRFIADPYFEPFLEPMVMGRRVDRLCGAPTDMHTLLDANAHFLECRASMLQVMEDSFATMRQYLIRFENAGQLYREDLIKDPKTIIDETDVAVLKAYGDRFSNEILFMESLIAKQPIGVFNFNQIPIKETTVPVVNALMSVLSVTVPLVARNKVILMNEVIQKIMKGLNKIPKTTDDFVDYLQNLESAPDLVDQLDIDMEYVKECYDIIGEHDMNASEADIDAYYDIGAEIGICRAAVELGLDKRGKLTDDFNDLLGQDISRLIQHVGDIRDAALQPWIIDADTDPDQAKAVLNKLLELQNDCILKSQEYRNYQKLFKVELTKFDFLDEVSTDIRLRILLWDSIESWIDTLSEWYTCNFYDLDPEEMKNFTIKMLKNVNQIEKNFPKDTQLVQSFREDVEFFSNRLNVVSYLRNPDLKARHWLEIERIMSRKFPAGESLTLEKFEEAGCFDWTDELMEVSGKASSEAGLELLLKKVEDAWKEQELSVVNHRNSKDIFILAGLEELQLVIDDSNININTISASRHVGPIKPRVDEWARLLELFSTTIDEWIKCQQSWMYLEAIFGAPDIQRQLPKEAKLFNIVDKSFKDIMRKAYKTPLAMPCVTAPGLLETFQKNNALLEQITKCLEAYLEIKRVGFPRFYFLSNDELLEILAQTRNPFAVQPHLRKCFDAIAKLEFGQKTAEAGDDEPLGTRVMTTDIVAMLSPETERVQLGKGLKARGSVEDWLGKVEESMFLSLKRCMKTSLLDFPTRPRLDWLTRHASQIILIVSQIMWAREVHAMLEGANVSHQLKKFETSSLTSLTSCAAMARTDISQLLRKVLCALITVDVHARDTITHMIDANVKSTNDFEWLKMIRYYWLPGPDTVEARMSSASLPYRYEYLGAGGVLVITPLTDRCYLCLMGALQMKLGGAPAGPAGTGKTETTKDLAKALAVQCVVFNCSEGLDYKMMGRFFSGLAQAGAWCCFDEFNRIDIEVLSVIAQQLVTIKNAKVANAERFMFEGRIIKLNPACATFITMNPGYAGRTELPDNLKAMFRPQAMMVPDYALIAEVVLYSEGFESSKPLAQKMVQMYKLCSEQLSIQDHYDFGMRAVKSVLVMAGALKRAAPDQPEDITLICALRDSNLPKFLADDVLLFKGILGDLFPGVELPKQDYGVFQENIEEVMKEHGLQPVPEMVTKIIQLHETMIVRWGVMLVGPTGGGKSTVLKCLGYALARLFEKEEPGQYYRPVVKYTLNPKSVLIDELYGAVNKLSLEWRDGLLGLAVRAACGTDEEIHQWCILDGPVDAMWIENLNTVLDDNKMLCLANSERIKLTPWVHFLFEVMDLAQASPATVSRCGMVYVDPDDLGWLPYVRSWLKRLPEGTFVPELVKIVLDLFENYLTRIMAWVNKMCEFAIHQVDIGKVTLLCCLFEELLKRAGPQGIAVGAPVGDTSKSRCFVTQSFIFAALWSVGGNLLRTSQDALDTYMKDTFDDHLDARIPLGGDLWTLYMNTEERRLELWEKIVPEFIYDTNTPFFDMLVPTSDTARYGHVTAILLEARHPVMLTGDTGVGKSVIAKAVLARLSVETECIPAVLNFSAQTSSLNTQEMIELRLEKRKKTVIGAPLGKYAVIFVDDVNMPKLETYGSQPPIELLRQFLDYGGLYDRSKLYWKNILDVVLACACAPPGGGRNPLTPRFTRHFAMFLIPPPQDTSMKVIFRSILDGFLVEFVPVVKALAASLVAAAVEIYQTIEEELLPTPAKSHYVFNLRDLSKCVQGILQADSSIIRDVPHMLRLFYHENLRVYHDRLINDEDKNYFKELLRDVSNRAFGNPIVEDDNAIILFGDFMVMSMPIEERVYEEIVDIRKLKTVLQDYLDDYSVVTGNDMQIIMFLDAIEHTIRLARLLRAERGNGLLIGLSGMGKQSLTKLGAHLNGYKCAQVELTRGYDNEAFHEDLRHFCWSAGALNIPTVFLFTDTQILQEEFLEDINNLLNSGEVPNLFVADDYEMMIIACRQGALEVGIKDATRDQLYNFFIARVRANLHIVLSMSPVGDAFRRRCRMFPSLVNCCTIDWFVKWPQDALLSVAQNVLKDMGTEEMVDNLARICVKVHASVEDAAENFFKSTKRRYYVTPSSYLELLRLYKSLLAKRVDKITMSKERIATGLTKIDETNVIVAAMKIELVDMEPKLAQKSVELGELMVHLEEEQVKVNQVREVVTRDEATAAEIAASTKILAEDAQKDLSTALPALLAAQDALKKLKKKDIDELKAFQNPPILVRFVMESVCLLLNHKIDWPSAKQLLATGNVLQILQDYDKDHIPDKTLVKLKKYIDNKDFNPETLKKVSKVARSMCMWVQAIDIYAKVAKVVEPKRVKLKEAQDKLFKVVTLLRSKQKELADVEAYLQRLQDQFETGLQEQVALEDNMELCASRLNRAGRLTSALADEQRQWKISVTEFNREMEDMLGNILVAASCVAYLGAFTSQYREELVESWSAHCLKLKIPFSKNFSLVAVLGDPYFIRMWNMHGLPRDPVSTDNAIMMTEASRWPLLIDPQEQANRWIRSMELENDLKITKLSNPNLNRLIESAVRNGLPVLIEEIGEELDPTLAPILNRQTVVVSGRILIRLGDTDVDYDPNFKLYMTSKLSNPHYLPEVCIQVTLVNFTVTPIGLEDQLLSDVVRLERHDLEEQRTQLIMSINEDKQQLSTLEERVLKLLFHSEGCLLDDEELVEALNESKETSAIIEARLIEAETTEEKITKAREKYRTLAARGSILYFVVEQLGDVDPMYQFSLKYFAQIFCTVIKVTEKSSNLEERLSKLMTAEIYSIYVNVARGLFAKHKVLFSFLLSVAVERQLGRVSQRQWNFLLRGPVASQVEPGPKPAAAGLTDAMWLYANHLPTEFPDFSGLPQNVLKVISITLGDFKQEISITGGSRSPSSVNFDSKLRPFDKLLMLKALQEEKLVFAIGSYVRLTLGKQFTESPPVTLANLYADMNSFTPLVFVLSPGSDPLSPLQKFATERKMMDRLESISLGQGQGPVAAALIEKGRSTGMWVYLQNCHLAKSWMPTMEVIVQGLALGLGHTHKDFRLFLSSMPADIFPVSVLQNSVKVTNEPPRGIRANMKLALYDMTPEFFEVHPMGHDWRSMIFGLTLFHGIVLERKKFGPLGWNITYEFSDSDRECALKVLEMFCATNVQVPWDALEYINGEITYGGRVTDEWDQRCLKTILQRFFSPITLQPGYKYSPTGTYYCPNYKTLKEFITFTDKLPSVETPEIFGMHGNADLVYQINETTAMINTLLEGAPTDSGVSGINTDDVVFETAQDIIDRIIKQVGSRGEPHLSLTKLDSKGRVPSLTTVLTQEVDRFNKLLTALHASLENLQKAIKGFVVMSEELEGVYAAFINNQVPAVWAEKAYPSLKCLASWVHDLELRLDFIETWYILGLPTSFWVSGFFFPQGFMTGALQTYSRKHDYPIDKLTFDFQVLKTNIEQERVYNAHRDGVKDSPALYGNVKGVQDGIIMHGLFLDAARWDMSRMEISDAYPGEMTPPLPAMHLEPKGEINIGSRYECPMYKTSARAGVLSTTGHSTNFVVKVLLPTSKPQSYWILQGTALLTQTTD